MEVSVEGQTFKIDLPRDNVKLSEVIDEVEGVLMEVGRVPVSLRLDGRQLTQEELEERLDQIMTVTSTLEFGVENIFDYIVENLKGASEANKSLTNDFKALSEQIDGAQKNVGVSRFVQELQQFFEFWVRLTHLVPNLINEIRYEGETLEQALDNFKNLLIEVVDALEANDNVLASDLIEYEILPMIEMVDSSIPTLVSRLEEMKALESNEESQSKE